MFRISEKLTWQKNVGLVLFAFYCFTAGIFQIPGTQYELDNIFLIKRTILTVALIFMILCVNWQSYIVRKILTIFSAWLLVLCLNLVMHGNLAEVGFKVLQSTAILVIICFFSQNFSYVKKFFETNFILFPIFLLFLLTIFVSSFFLEDINSLIGNGFGGNRVNFSLWLSQFTLLFSVIWCFGYLPLFQNSKWHLLGYIVYILPLLLLQLSSGGRLGLLTSLLSITLVIFYKSKSRVMTKICLMLCGTATLYLFYFYSSLGVHLGNSENIFRVVNVLLNDDKEILIKGIGYVSISELQSQGVSGLDFYFYLFDFITSYRLTLFIEGIKSIDLNTFMFGVGFGKFLVTNVAGVSQHVHNTFLNCLGEAGFSSLLILLFVVLFPFFALPKSKETNFIKISLGIWFFQASFQPEFFYSQVGNSFCFWIIFAYALRKIFKANDKNYQF